MTWIICEKPSRFESRSMVILDLESLVELFLVKRHGKREDPSFIKRLAKHHPISQIQVTCNLLAFAPPLDSLNIKVSFQRAELRLSVVGPLQMGWLLLTACRQ